MLNPGHINPPNVYLIHLDRNMINWLSLESKETDCQGWKFYFQIVIANIVNVCTHKPNNKSIKNVLFRWAFGMGQLRKKENAAIMFWIESMIIIQSHIIQWFDTHPDLAKEHHTTMTISPNSFDCCVASVCVNVCLGGTEHFIVRIDQAES